MLNTPNIILGSAMWGWTVDRTTVFSLLDEWYAAGFREVDAATNYPIDRNPDHFRLSEKMLLEWIGAHGVSDLKVMMKIGSVNNLYTPEHILTKSFMLMMIDEYKSLFKDNLDTVMVHWDNRESETEIAETLEAFQTAKVLGLRVGLSGIRHPEIYAKHNNQFGFDFRIQLKHNVLHSDYQRYKPFHGKRSFIAYGINAGGIKLNKSDYSDTSTLKARGGNTKEEAPIIEEIRTLIQSKHVSISSFNEIGMIYAFHHPDIQAILLGTSKVEQLKNSIKFHQTLQTGSYMEVYNSLISVISAFNQSTINH